MNKATTKELTSSYVCSLFNGHRLAKVNEAIKNGEKFAQIELPSCSCHTPDYSIQSSLVSTICEHYNSTSLGVFYARIGKRTFIVSYKI